MKKIFLIATALVFIILITCSCSSDNSTSQHRTVVLVGALINGDAQGDPDTQAAVRLATEDINRYLETVGSNIRIMLQVEAAGLDPERAIEGLSLLQEAGVAIVVGPESSVELAAILSMADFGQTVLISHCSTASSLAIADGAFRLVPNDLSQTRIIARRIAASKASGAVLVYRNDVFGLDIATSLRQELASRGITVLGELAYDVNTTDFTPVLTQLQTLVSANPECVVQLSAFGPDATLLFESAATFSELAKVRWFGSDGTAKSLQILESTTAKKFALDTAFESPLFGVPQTQKAQTVSARIAAASGVEEPQVCSLTAYDAVWLATLTLLSNRYGSYQTYVNTLPFIADHFYGASGLTTLNSAGDRIGGVYDIWIMSGNEWIVGARMEDE